MHQRLACRADLPEGIARVKEDACRAGLGHTEPLRQGNTTLRPVFHDRQCARRPPDSGHAKAREVGVGEIRMLHHELIWRRHGEEMGNTLSRVAQHPQCLTRVESLQHHNRATGVQHGVAVTVQPAGVKERQHVEVNRVDRDPSGNPKIDAVPEVHAVGDHRPLRQARRARRVHDRDDIVVGKNGPTTVLTIEARDYLLVGAVGRPTLDLEKGAYRAQLLKLGGCCGELGIVDHQLGRAVVEDVFEFGHCQPPVEQHGNRAKTSTGKLHIEKFDTVVREHGYTVAAADPQRRHICSHRIDPAIKIGIAEGLATAKIADRLVCRSVIGVIGNPVVGRHRAVTFGTRHGERRQWCSFRDVREN